MVYDANGKVNKIIDDFRADFARTSESTRAKYVKELPAGARVPEQNKIFDSEEVSAFSERANKYRQDATDILNRCLDDISKAKAESPSSEAVNVLTLMSARQNVTADELSDVIRNYGSNYQVYRSCQDISVKNNLGRLADHPLQAKEQSINDLQSNLNRLFTYNDACKNANGGFYSFIQMAVDNALSE